MIPKPQAPRHWEIVRVMANIKFSGTYELTRGQESQNRANEGQQEREAPRYRVVANWYGSSLQNCQMRVRFSPALLRRRVMVAR